MHKNTKGSLSGVPETMLYTLYNRVYEAKRNNSIIHDPEAIRIFESIDFDFVDHFGSQPRGGMASRAVMFDKIVTEWLKTNPSGCIVSLGEGLETQQYRVDNGKVRWLSVDLPEAIAFRERFIKPTKRFRHLSQSAFDFSWMVQADPSQGIFITAQGLLMYFKENQVRELISEIFKRFPKAYLLFDFVSESFVRKTQKGLQITNRYRLPPMNWGIGHDEIASLLRSWLPEIISIQITHYDIFTRGLPHLILDLFLRRISPIGNQLPGIAYLHGFQNR